MSVHGNQNLLPLFLRKETNKPDIKENAELAMAYYLLTSELKESEKILSFSRLLWPLLLIQGIISTHIGSPDGSKDSSIGSRLWPTGAGV